MRHSEQRDCDWRHGELRISASGSVAKAMTRAALLAAVALSAAMIAFGQQAAVALGVNWTPFVGPQGVGFKV